MSKFIVILQRTLKKQKIPMMVQIIKANNFWYYLRKVSHSGILLDSNSAVLTPYYGLVVGFSTQGWEAVTQTTLCSLTRIEVRFQTRRDGNMLPLVLMVMCFVAFSVAF